MASSDPDKAIKVWIEHLGKFSFCGGKIYSYPFLYLDIRSTLFCPSSIYEQDNSELYNLNQPLLEEALKNWENSIGEINDIEGVEGIYKYGFLPNE